MDSCCQSVYDRTFDLKTARHKLAHYLEKGPDRCTSNLIEWLQQHLESPMILMDIGGGAGAILWELMDGKVQQAYYQEISQAYANVVQDEARRRGWEERVHVGMGDFVEQHHRLPQVDVVTLDRVICCYENYQELVRLSARKARRYYGYIIPYSVWWVKTVHLLFGWILPLLGLKIKTYVHPMETIESLTCNEGFEKVHQRQQREWLTVLYRKTNPAVSSGS